jgi:hypothetical protein
LSALRDVASAVDPALAAYAVEDPGKGELEALVAHRGRAFVIEAIREGYLLHYHEPRCFTGMDDDLRLLAGDALFALGLERLAATGDLGAVTELSDLITGSARAEAEGRMDDVPALWRQAAERLSSARGERRGTPDRDAHT